MFRTFVVPALAADVLSVRGRRAIERLSKGQFDAAFDDLQAAHGINRLAGETHAVEAGDLPGVALPFAQARDVKLTVLLVELRAHHRRRELEREFHHAAL